MGLPPLIAWAKFFFPAHAYQESPGFHWVLAEKLLGPSKRKAYVCPRGFAKSTILSLFFIIYCCAHRLKKYIILISDTAGQAEQLLDDIKNEFETNDVLLFFYPGLTPSKKPWRKDEISLACGIRIKSLGIGQRIRGRKKGGSRPDLIIMDESENDDAVKKLERRHKLWKWLFSAVMPALVPVTGELIIIGTILHRASMLAKAIKIDGWDTCIWRALQDDGTSLWEERIPAAELVRLREEAESVGLLDEWYQEYQGISRSPEGAPFLPSDISYFTSLPVAPDGDPLRFYKSLYVDPALSETDKADWTGYTVVYASHNGFWYIVEAFRRKHDPAQSIETIFQLHKKHNLDIIGIESVAYQKSLAFWCRVRARDELEYLPIETVPITGADKRTRIMGLQPFFRAKRIKLRVGLPERLSEELLFLDEIDHDDIADSLSGHLRITIRPEPPKMREAKYADAATERAAKHRAELERIGRMKRRNIDLGYIPK